jgi:hypothetical protein
MKPLILAVAVVACLLAHAAMADVAGHDVNEVVLTAELTFSAASLYLGATNGQQGYIGHRSLSASLFGFSVGVTSLVLSTADDAEVPALDVAAGIVAVAGSWLRLPRLKPVESQHAVVHDKRSAGPRGLEFVPGFRRLKIQVSF